MLDAVEAVVYPKGHHSYIEGDHVEEECTEVADQRYDEQRVGQLYIHIRREDAEAVPEVVLVQGCRRCSLPPQVYRYREDADDYRNYGQRPDRAVWRHSLSVQESEM